MARACSEKFGKNSEMSTYLNVSGMEKWHVLVQRNSKSSELKK